MTTQSDIELVLNFMNSFYKHTSFNSDFDAKDLENNKKCVLACAAFNRIIENTLSLDELPDGWKFIAIEWRGYNPLNGGETYSCKLKNLNQSQFEIEEVDTHPLGAFFNAVAKAKENVG
jgi:hypothetical protein